MPSAGEPKWYGLRTRGVAMERVYLHLEVLLLVVLELVVLCLADLPQTAN
ncbi:MAG: hypothetical protein NVS3B18_11280 [Candidatus Dormibacteria bacterium]